MGGAVVVLADKERKRMDKEREVGGWIWRKWTGEINLGGVIRGVLFSVL